MKTVKITSIRAMEILDSRGNPTLRTEVVLSNGARGVAAVPSGASTGVHEALELRDGGPRYGGKGVQKAVRNVNRVIAPVFEGTKAGSPRMLDATMLRLDDTVNKSNLGANAILSVSLAYARAMADSERKPLYKWLREAYGLTETKWHMPQPTMNVINGGRHADDGLSIQEFMIVPHHRRLSERVRIGAEVFHALAELLHKKGLVTSVGDEGGFAPTLPGNESALKLLVQAIKAAGYAPGGDVSLAIDLAASEFYDKTGYALEANQSAWSSDQMIAQLDRWVKHYPIVSLEDGLAEDDWKGWAKLTKRLGEEVLLIGDDLFVTNATRLQQGIDQAVGNAILIKLNQIGTLSETMDTIYLAKANGYAVSVSHRSGETADTFIADLAVAVNAEFIKTGSLSRSERVEKYNRLMEIEAELLHEKNT